MQNFAIGVDLGGTNLRIAAVAEDGTLLEKVTTGTRVAMGRDQVITDMCDAIQALKARVGEGRRMSGIGIGVPGIIDMDLGMLRESPNLPGWNDYPVHEEIERQLGAPVVLENDANAAVLGEKWLGAGQSAESICMLTLGTGVGGGIVLNGRVWHGMNGMAGELGHITVNPDGPACACGSRGCVEQYASATAIKRMAVEAIANGRAPELARAMSEEPEFSAKVVYQMAVQGDQPAAEIFRRVGWALGVVIAGLVNALNLQMYVIGGGVVSAWDAFAPALIEEVQKRSFVYAATAPAQNIDNTAKRTVITRALLGSDAGLYGAARLPFITEAVSRPVETIRSA